MANWNLSVDMRAQGDDLARELRASATQARSLGRAARTAQTSVRSLGSTADTAAGHLQSLASNAQDADTNLGRLGTTSSTTRRRLAQLASQAHNAAGDMRRLADEAERAEDRLRRAGGAVNYSIQLDDQTAAGLAAVTATVAQIRALSPLTIDVQFDVDAATAAAALQAAQTASTDTAEALRLLRRRAAATADALDELADQARNAARGLGSLNSAARTADTRLGNLSTSSRTLRTDLDSLDGSLRRIGSSMGTVRGSLGSLSNSTASAGDNTSSLMLAAAGLATALIPIAAATVPIAAGLTAGGIAVGVFTAAIGGQIAALSEASEAEKKYDDAVREHGANSAEATKAQAEHLHLLSEMPPATREAAAAYTTLKDDYSAWSDALSDDTMPVATKAMGLLGMTLEPLSPLVRGTADELDRFMNVAAGGMQTEGFDRFVTKFTDFAVNSLARGTTGLVKFSQAMDTGEMGADLREFLDYARANAPLVGETLGNLAKVMMNLLIAGSEMGVSVLQLVNALAKLVNAVPPEALSVMIQLYAAWKLAALGAAMLTAATGGAAAASLAAFVRSARFGGVGPAVAGVTQRMSGLAKAAVGLGVLAVAAMGINELAENARGAPPDVDKLTTSLKNLSTTGKMTGELKNTFGDFDGLIDKMEKLSTESDKAKEAAEGVFGFRIPVLDDIGGWFGDAANDMAKGGESLKALEEDFEAVDQALAGLVASGNPDQAAAGFDLITKAGRKAGWSTKEINALVSGYMDSLKTLDAENRLAAAGMGVFGEQALATKTKLDAQKASADGLRASIVALNDTNRAAYDSQIAFEGAIDALTASFKEHGATLDLDTEAGRKNGTAMSQAAKAHDEMIAAGLAAGESLGSMTGKSDTLRASMMRLATEGFDGNKAKATEYVNTLLGVPGDIKTYVRLEREEAISGLKSVQDEIRKTPGAKTVTVSTLNGAAIAALEAVGLKTRTLPDGRTEVFTANGQALGPIGAVLRALANLNGRTAHTYTTHTVTTHYKNVGARARTPHGQGSQIAEADGGIVDYYANGGIRGGKVQRFASGGTSPDTKNGHVAHIAKAGTWRVFAEDETGGESYVPLHPSKRVRSRAITEETVRRLGGDPEGIQWNANGGISSFASGGFNYTPDAMRRTTSDVQSAYSSAHQPITRDEYVKKLRARANATDTLRAAEAKLKQVRKGKHSRADVVAAEGRVAKARRGLATATDAARKAEARYKKTFSLSDWQKTLKSAVSANASWEANLSKIASRGGADVVDQLRGMGEEGAAMVAALAKATNKQFADIVKNLRKLGPLAKASLGDYTKQLGASNATNSTFQKNLARLAGMGYGDLAAQLAAQGDDAAQKIAAEAVKDKGKASKANKAAKTANNALTGDQVEQLIAIIAAVKTSKTGLHDVAETTGLGEDEIVAVATKAHGQIRTSLGSRAARFLSDLHKAQRGLSYANGGIREGIYSTRAGAVTFAEPSTGGEAFIPLGANKRGPAMNVLKDVAGRFGLGLQDARSSKAVIIRQGGDTYVTVQPIRSDATGSDIGAQVGRSVRRANRGGVNAHAGS